MSWLGKRGSAWRGQLGRVLPFVMGGLLVIAVNYVVHATSGGATKPSLSFSGTLRLNGNPVMGAQTLTYTFKKAGMAICAPTVMVTPDASSGAFTAQIDISGCPVNLFDGSDVTFDLSVGNNVVAMAQPINAVPYAKYSDTYGSPDCPLGYTRNANVMGIVDCVKGTDEMVKVGTGQAAFWIDRYEASVWQNPDGTGMQYGLMNNDLMNVNTFYAVSKSGVAPASFMFLDWSYAACAAAGKQLPTANEWITAGMGTPTTINDQALNGDCNSGLYNQGNPPAPRNTGMGTKCASVWGAEDMAGNINEAFEASDISGRQLAGLQSGGGRNIASIFAVEYETFPSINLGGQVLPPNSGFRCVIPR